MKNPLFIILYLSLLILGMNFEEGPPKTTISNGLVTAKIYLPDSVNGYYRGTRFDWGGVVYDLEYNGHHYFGKWFDKYEPTLHDAIMGPVDSFNPIGYDEANVGEGFLRIGVGVLEKPDEARYAFSTPYKLLNGGKWKVKRKSSSITFTHELDNTRHRYVYTKILHLPKGKGELVLEHTLKNTGPTIIETEVYNHNFFVIDQQPTGPDFIVKFPFVPGGDYKGKTDAAAIEGRNIIYKRALSKGEFFALSPLTGYGTSSDDSDLRIENIKTGAGVRIVGDKPIVKFVYWSAAATLCPEPYIKVKVNPGEEMSWTIRYEFYSTF